MTQRRTDTTPVPVLQNYALHEFNHEETIELIMVYKTSLHSTKTPMSWKANKDQGTVSDKED